ncbi:MAG TPA: glycosyltransferase family A protein [Candidatus Paceibacterota bacterium]|nr:glycosyltransferase family A protein [Candidatus Paceibacterota bacterium]
MQNYYENTPLVSIIMPTYRRADFLPDTIQSVLSQTYKNIELIIVCDPSPDKTIEVLLPFSIRDPRVKIIENKTRMKHIPSLNIGLRRAEGKYVARADDDDPWINKNKLVDQISFLEENPEYVIVGTGTIVVNAQRKELFKYQQPNSDQTIRAKMLFGNPFISSSVVFRRATLEKTGLFDENLGDVEDWDLWMKIGTQGKLYNFQTFDIHRHYGERGLSVRNRKNVAKTRMQLIVKYRKQYPHFILAFIFNGFQRLYAFFPYIKILDDFLFKLKRLVLSK